MYLNGMGLRGIQRVTDIHHTTVLNWIKDAGIKLPPMKNLANRTALPGLSFKGCRANQIDYVGCPRPALWELQHTNGRSKLRTGFNSVNREWVLYR